MLRSKIVSVVNTCARHGWPVVIIAAILAVLCGYYSAVNFTIDTNVNKLISRDLDWRKNELTLDAAFPYRHEIIVAVVEAPTSELASQATAELIEKLATQTKVFKSVTEPAGGAFFSKNALLFASLDQTGVGQLVQMGTDKGRQTTKELKVGVCGEHGGDPKSVHFFHKVGLDYVSCSPFRVPVARLAAAQAVVRAKNGGSGTRDA